MQKESKQSWCIHSNAGTCADSKHWEAKSSQPKLLPFLKSKDTDKKQSFFKFETPEQNLTEKANDDEHNAQRGVINCNVTPALDPSRSQTMTDLSNPALKDFNKSQTEPQTKKKQERKRKSSQKFPMPRNYKPNEYPDRKLSPLELTREMIEYYDFNRKSIEYQ